MTWIEVTYKITVPQNPGRVQCETVIIKDITPEGAKNQWNIFVDITGAELVEWKDITNDPD